MNKTPVTVLQELAIKKDAGVPVYELIKDGTATTDKIFVYRLTVFDLSVEGTGRSKKDAKHDAANNLLEILRTSNILNENFGDVDLQHVQSIDGNSVGELMDLCIQREISFPAFRLINASGPSHAPEFTIECAVSSMVRQATHSTKKGAKQMVASKMVNILQNMSYDHDNKAVALSNVCEKEEHKKTKKIKTYLEYRNSDQKYTPGIKLNNRHNYIVEMDNDLKAKARQIIQDPSFNIQEKVREILGAWETEYIVTDIITSNGPHKIFEMKGDYDCVLIATEDQIWAEVLTFIYTMLM